MLHIKHPQTPDQKPIPQPRFLFETEPIRCKSKICFWQRIGQRDRFAKWTPPQPPPQSVRKWIHIAGSQLKHSARSWIWDIQEDWKQDHPWKRNTWLLYVLQKENPTHTSLWNSGQHFTSFHISVFLESIHKMRRGETKQFRSEEGETSTA